MQPADAQRLRLRREHLQLRLRRGEEARQFREFAALLQAAGVRRFSRLPPVRVRALKARRLNLPGRDERLYWPEIPEGTCLAWKDEHERNAAFARALQACFAPGVRLVLITSSSESALVLGYEDAIAHAGLLLDAANWRLWVICLDGSPGVVEACASDNEVCWLPP